MSDRRFLVPASGLRVIDPMTERPLPEGGAWVTESSYWIRRIGERDVTELAAEPEPPASTQTARRRRRSR